MSKIAIKTILKTTNSYIGKVEDEIHGLGDVYIDKPINRKVEREISHLGKEKLLVDHICGLSKKYNEKNKNKILFLLINLYKYNKQIHESISRELRNDKKLLNNRIKKNINKKQAHKDIYKKLLKIADKHYNIVKTYVEHFNPKKSYPPKLILRVAHHKDEAEKIYKSLTNFRMKKTLHKVLLIKLDEVYKALIKSTVQLASMITLLIKDIKKNRRADIKKRSKHIQDIISSKTEILRDFAYKYTYNIIHSEEFLDFDNHKIVLITKKHKF